MYSFTELDTKFLQLLLSCNGKTSATNSAIKISIKNKSFFFGSEISQTITKFIRSRQLKFRQKFTSTFWAILWTYRQTDRYRQKHNILRGYNNMSVCEWICDHSTQHMDQCKGKMTLLTIRGYVITKLLKSTTDSVSSLALVTLLITFEFWSLDQRTDIHVHCFYT